MMIGNAIPVAIAIFEARMNFRHRSAISASPSIRASIAEISSVGSFSVIGFKIEDAGSRTEYSFSVGGRDGWSEAIPISCNFRRRWVFAKGSAHPTELRDRRNTYGERPRRHDRGQLSGVRWR